jgi:hypothetical protein
VVTAPQNEIGYANAPRGWWTYDETETTPELQWPMAVQVYDQMRRQDAQVASVLRAVTLPVRRTPWRIDPAGAKARVTQFIADELGLPVVGKEPKPVPRTRDRFSWPEHLQQALLMLPFGHMFFEQVYRVDAGGDRAHLRKLAPRMPRTIETIAVADDGGLISITQVAPVGVKVTPRPIPVDRLVAYVHDREGGNWLGFSLLRPAYKHWLIKDRLLRVQAQTIERNGMGVPLYKAAEGEVSLTAGSQMAQAWRAGESAGAAIPYGADMVLRGVEGGLPDANPAIRYHDEQIARAVLAHFLNLGTQTGSWALGTTFADFFTLSLQTLAQQIADTLRRSTSSRTWSTSTSAPTEPAPRVVFDEIGSRQAATAAALKSLADAGLINPDDVLQQAVRQQFGLPATRPGHRRAARPDTRPWPAMARLEAPMADLTGVELARPGTWQVSSGARECHSRPRCCATPPTSTPRPAPSGSRWVSGTATPVSTATRRSAGSPTSGTPRTTPARCCSATSSSSTTGSPPPRPDRWPHRSIEGVAGVTFNGREYGLALTRLALLGSTPPGIPVLKSLPTCGSLSPRRSLRPAASGSPRRHRTANRNLP